MGNNSTYLFKPRDLTKSYFIMKGINLKTWSRDVYIWRILHTKLHGVRVASHTYYEEK